MQVADFASYGQWYVRKSNPLAREKVRILSKKDGVFTPERLPALEHGSKMNGDNKSANWNDKLDIKVYWCIE